MRDLIRYIKSFTKKQERVEDTVETEEDSLEFSSGVMKISWEASTGDFVVDFDISDAEDESSHTYESDIETIDISHQKLDEDEVSEFGIDFENFSEEDPIEIPMQTIQTIFTPFGVMPLTEQSLASSYFKFWVGHTNFKITTSFHKIISDIDGVETLDIFSPYRFRISVAKLFRDRDVMSNIRKSMVSYAKGQKNEDRKEGHP
jgi:hypothetical protein